SLSDRGRCPVRDHRASGRRPLLQRGFHRRRNGWRRTQRTRLGSERNRVLLRAARHGPLVLPAGHPAAATALQGSAHADTGSLLRCAQKVRAVTSDPSFGRIVMSSQGQLQSLQILRAVAATSVIYFHTNHEPHFGGVGLDLFLVLSGFVISMLVPSFFIVVL